MLTWSVIVSTFLLVIIATRFVTGVQGRTFSQEPTIVPYWIPWMAHRVSYRQPHIEWLQRLFKRLRTGVFAVVGWGHKYHVIISPSVRDQVLQQSYTHVDRLKLTFSMLETFLGDRGKTAMLAERSPNQDYWAKYRNVSSALDDEPFLGKCIQNLATSLEGQTWNLISGNDSWVDQEMWERNAQVKVIAGQSSDQDFVAEADLHVLLSEWVGHMVVSQLMGRAFLQENPTVVNDVFMMDSRKSAFSSPLPTFLMPGLLPSLYARERIIRAIQEFHDAITKSKHDQDPGLKYDDLGDVSELIWDMIEIHRHAGADTRTTAIACLLILWTVVMETTQLTFWYIFHIYSNKELTEQIRNEIKTFIQLKYPQATGLAITESPRLKIDAQGLLSKPVSMKSALLEVLRLESSPCIYLNVTKDFMITESQKDASLYDKVKPATYTFRHEERILVPSRLHHLDSKYFPNPNSFQPKRFHHNGAESKYEIGTMRGWDRGENIVACGLLVERQVLLFAAAFVSIWDIRPADNALFNAFQGWQHPGRNLTVGICKPSKDIRVKIWHRKQYDQ